MSTTTTAANENDTYWWQGSLMRIKARAADTDGAFAMVEGTFYEGFGPPLHVHRREDEGLYVLEGEILIHQGDEQFVAGPGTLSWGPRGVPHAFKVRSPSARALVLITPGGFEEMFVAGGIPLAESPDPPVQEYDPEAAEALAERFGFEVVGPQLD